LIRFLRIKIPCASRSHRPSRQHVPVLRSAIAIHRDRPSGCCGTSCDARHRGRRPDPKNPSIHGLPRRSFGFCGRMPPKWGPCGAASARRKGRRLARTMRASSLYVQGCAYNEPRSTLAHSEGRMPGERRTGVAFSLVTFLLAKQEKVTRSLKASGSCGTQDVLANLKAS
jgi:hypothetical protein